MPKFDIMLYLVLNLTLYIAFAKFNVKFDIALENAFYTKMPKFDISTQIWQCIGCPGHALIYNCTYLNYIIGFFFYGFVYYSDL